MSGKRARSTVRSFSCVHQADAGSRYRAVTSLHSEVELTMDYEWKSLLAVCAVLLVLTVPQSMMVFIGCKVAHIRRTTYRRSLAIAGECLVWQIMTFPLLSCPSHIPILGPMFFISVQFMIPTGVIKKRCHVQYEQAFWAACWYIGTFLLIAVVLSLIVWVKR